ncbi:MAG: AAA family ATPase [Solirubrobacteraceae bacterium]|nr:AAA family ATPase [Solirubrobacteraceae bacterium]
MRISQVRVQNFRCIADLTVDIGSLTAIVGSGGVGKSSFLRALEWFFRGGPLDERDLWEGANTSALVSVAVVFDGINEADRQRLGKYAVGSSTTFTRTWRPGETDKLSGSALVFPEFDEIRAASGGIDRRQRFAAYVEEHGERVGCDGPAPRRVAEADAAMEQREREHPEQCVVRSEDARHLFGIAGEPRLVDRFDLVLIGASDDAGVALDTGKASALGRLLTTIGELDTETAQQVADLQSQATEKIQDLVTSAQAEKLSDLAQAITERVQHYIPGVAVQLTPEVLPPRPPALSVDVTVQDQVGHATDVARQGHGIQRALVIGLLHEIADRVNETDHADSESSSGESAPATLMLGIEEPELYQHPLQARSLADTLAALATASENASTRSVQVVYTTHSPHFVKPAVFEDIRVFRRGQDGATEGVAADIAKVSETLKGVDITAEIDAAARMTLSSTLAEAIFARGVVLCEGTSDAALIGAAARLSGGLDRDGIAVVASWGKTVIPLAFSILRQLDIPTFVVFDGDAGVGDRLRRKERLTEAQRTAQVEAVKAKNRQLLALNGETPTDWPDREIRPTCANFRDRLENDLDEIWPSLGVARNRVASELGISAKADEVYRRAVQLADTPPPFVTDLLRAIRNHVTPSQADN